MAEGAKRMKIQAAVYFPVTVDIDVDIHNPLKAREEILDQAGYILETSMIEPTLENVVALPEHGKSYVDITKLFEEEVLQSTSEAVRKHRYRIACWIPVEPEEEEIYENLEDAGKDLEHYQLLQPEN